MSPDAPANKTATAPEAPEPDRTDPSRWVEALPLLGLIVAIVLSATHGFPTGLIVIGASLLLAGIWSLWVSLQIVAGDRSVLTEASSSNRLSPSREQEQKAYLLRALEDLEFERSVGKIDEDDYQALRHQYRARAKAALSADHQEEPARTKALALVSAYLEAHNARRASEPAVDGDDSPQPPRPWTCPSCNTANDADALFCKRCGKPHSEDPPTSEDMAP